MCSYSSVNQIAYDWAGGNWYFLDDSKEVIFLCQERKDHSKMMCLSIVSVRLSKPRGIALDPSEGEFFLFIVEKLWVLLCPSQYALMHDHCMEQTVYIGKCI